MIDELASALRGIRVLPADPVIKCAHCGEEKSRDQFAASHNFCCKACQRNYAQRRDQV